MLMGKLITDPQRVGSDDGSPAPLIPEECTPTTEGIPQSQCHKCPQTITRRVIKVNSPGGYHVPALALLCDPLFKP